jgi:hypothetical protein
MSSETSAPALTVASRVETEQPERAGYESPTCTEAEAGARLQRAAHIMARAAIRAASGSTAGTDGNSASAEQDQQDEGAEPGTGLTAAGGAPAIMR